jgi:hypothetical protein
LVGLRHPESPLHRHLAINTADSGGIHQHVRIRRGQPHKPPQPNPAENYGNRAAIINVLQ